MLSSLSLKLAAKRASSLRFASTAAASDKYKIVVVGGGSGGISVANQLYNRFKAAGKPLNAHDIVVIDAAEFHYYQPGWTLVGSGLIQPKSETRRPLASLIPAHIKHIPDNVASFSPHTSSLKTLGGLDVKYDALVVAAGLKINWDGIKGLKEALVHSGSGVTSIYSYESCDQVWKDIGEIRSGKAIFTQPAGVIKCAGAPQKIMWMAWDRFKKTARDNIQVDFYTGMPTMFSVKKYSDVLDALRVERGVGGYFQHNLTAIDINNHTATFAKADGTTATVDFTMLHVTPPMGPLDFIKNSPLADSAGWVSVNQATLQHTNVEYANVFAIGDCSSLPTSKTAAAITAQAPVLTENLFTLMDTGIVGKAAYDGYTSCPLLTGYGQLLLAEFRYGLEPKESFGFLNQAKPNRLFYHLKKDVFPRAYWNYMVKGRWFGKSGIFRPNFS